MKKSLITGLMAVFILAIGIVGFGGRNSGHYLTQWTFRNDSSNDVKVEIFHDSENPDSGTCWAPRQFTLGPGGIINVKHKEFVDEISFDYSNTVTADTSQHGTHTVKFINK